VTELTHGEIAALLRELLESSFPEVCKVPGREGGYIRVAISVNTEWYRKFCSRYMSWRWGKWRTIIKRCDTIRALQRIEAGDRSGEYAKRLEPFLTEEWKLYMSSPDVMSYASDDLEEVPF